MGNESSVRVRSEFLLPSVKILKRRNSRSGYLERGLFRFQTRSVFAGRGASGTCTALAFMPIGGTTNAEVLVTARLRGWRNHLDLRTVSTIVTAHIFCACQDSRARRERNAQHTGHAEWFCGKDASFFNRRKIISIYLVNSLKNRISMRMLLFLPYDRSDRTFYNQTKANSKTAKVIASRCYAWSLGIKKIP